MTISMCWKRVCAGALVLGVWSMCAFAQDAASVTVRDAGAEPREVLRYALTPGQVETGTAEMVLDMEVSVNGQAMPGVDLPAMRMGMRTVVSEAEGDAKLLTITIEDADVADDLASSPPMVIEAMREQLSMMEDASFQMTMTDRGVLTPVGEPKLREGVAPAVRQAVKSNAASMQNSGVVFPEGAVGVGAVWVYTVTQTLGGMTQTIETAYTLRKREGDRLVLETVQVSTGKPGPVELPDLPAGMTAELVGLAGSGGGTTTLRLDHSSPISAEFKIDVAIDMKMAGMGIEQAVSQNLATAMTMESAREE